MTKEADGHAEQDAWAAKRDYRPENTVCPRRIIGWNCFRQGAYDDSIGCPCDDRMHRGDWDRSALFDHTRAWRTPDGGLIITSEPYDIKVRDPRIGAYGKLLARYNLTIEASAESPYYPGWTTLLTISAKPAAQRLHDGLPLRRGYIEAVRGIQTGLKVWCPDACQWHTHAGYSSTEPGFTPGQIVAGEHGNCFAVDGEKPAPYVIEVQEAPFSAVAHLPQAMSAAQMDRVIGAQWSKTGKVPDSVIRLRRQPEPVPGGPIATRKGVVKQRKLDEKAWMASFKRGVPDAQRPPVVTHSGEWPHNPLRKADAFLRATGEITEEC